MTLGERMKDYEMQARTNLLKRTPVIIRLDGKAFHTFTRGMKKPFDEDLTKAMQYTMLELCKSIQGCVLGYTQSDEITLILVDYKELNTCGWFDNQVQKIVSVSASLATLFFNKYQVENNLWGNKLFNAVFDSRVFNVPKEEVVNCLIWRQQDATKNSISALAQTMYSHKALQGINSSGLQSKMLLEKSINWNDLPIVQKRGSCVIRVEGNWEIDNNIPIFTEDRDYIEHLIIFNDKE